MFQTLTKTTTMQESSERFDRLLRKQIKNQGGTEVHSLDYVSEKLGLTPERFIFHTFEFIDRHGDSYIEFNSDFTKVRIYGRKQSIFNSQHK